MNAKVIIINGKTYQSIDEMPPDIRRTYEEALSVLGDTSGSRVGGGLETIDIFADQNKNGIPDILENITVRDTVVNRMKIIIDGKEFDGIENLPPEARTRYEEAMSKLDANRNGTPDFIEGMIDSTNQSTSISIGFGLEAAPQPSATAYPSSERVSSDEPLPVDAVMASDAFDGWRLVLAGALVLLLCVAGAAGVWYFFLR